MVHCPSSEPCVCPRAEAQLPQPTTAAIQVNAAMRVAGNKLPPLATTGDKCPTSGLPGQEPQCPWADCCLPLNEEYAFPLIRSHGPPPEGCGADEPALHSPVLTD